MRRQRGLERAQPVTQSPQQVIMKSYFWPSSAVWETTLACNLRCRHCGSIAGHVRDDELTTAEALDVCDQLLEMSCIRVILSGGETLLRPDWPLLARRLLEGRAAVGIISNGLKIVQDPATLDELTALRSVRGGVTVGISIDGLETVHDSIRSPGSFAAAVAAVDALCSRQIPVVILSTVHHLNINDMRPLRDQVVFPREVYAWQMQTPNHYGRMRNHREWYLSRAEYLEVLDLMVESRRLRQSKPRTDPADCMGYLGAREADLRERPWHGCQAGLRAIGIQSNGNIKGCLSLLDDMFVEGNIRLSRLQEIWDREGAFAYNRDFNPSLLEGMCAGCQHGQQCYAGCRAVAHSVTGHLYRAPYCEYGFDIHPADQSTADWPLLAVESNNLSTQGD